MRIHESALTEQQRRSESLAIKGNEGIVFPILPFLYQARIQTTATFALRTLKNLLLVKNRGNVVKSRETGKFWGGSFFSCIHACVLYCTVDNGMFVIFNGNMPAQRQWL